MSALISSIYRAYCYARLLEMRRNRRRPGAANARPPGWSQRALARPRRPAPFWEGDDPDGNADTAGSFQDETRQHAGGLLSIQQKAALRRSWS
jgi:hypothetical protein